MNHWRKRVCYAMLETMLCFVRVNYSNFMHKNFMVGMMGQIGAFKIPQKTLNLNLPVLTLFLTRDSLYSWLLSSKFSLEIVAPLHVNWTAIRDGVLGPCERSNLALNEPNKSTNHENWVLCTTISDFHISVPMRFPV